MLKYPVIIFESDDWGTGPLKQDVALAKVNTLLACYSDSTGHHPVMTIGIILAEPDTDKIKTSQDQKYYRKTLADPKYSKILKVIQKGAIQGVNSIQLHGMEHFWPESIMQTLNERPLVKQWLYSNTEKKTEDLPSALQSRWINCGTLPSRNHKQEAIIKAIDEELLLYKKLFGHLPSIIVPPTFVWTNKVEQVYTQQGILALVTPGKQCIARDINGKLEYNNKSFFNGQENAEGLLFLVRNDYFEPSLGHKAETVIQSIKQKVYCGRPALLEMHRFNFINEQEDSIKSLQELKKLLELIQSDFVHVKYISTEQLAIKYRDYNQTKDSELFVSSPVQQIKIAMARFKHFFQFNRIAKYSGINLLLKLC